jgi:hypothetical protein
MLMMIAPINSSTAKLSSVPRSTNRSEASAKAATPNVNAQ